MRWRSERLIQIKIEGSTEIKIIKFKKNEALEAGKNGESIKINWNQEYEDVRWSKSQENLKNQNQSEF